MKVVSEKKNILLKRKELNIHFTGEANVSRLSIKEKVAKAQKVDESLVVVENVKNHFGSKDFEALVFIYENVEALNKATREHIKKRNSPKKAEGEE